MQFFSREYRTKSHLLVALATILALSVTPDCRADDAAPPKETKPAEFKLDSFKTNNFRLYTDLNEEEAKELLVRLETMLKYLSGYFGRKNTRPIEMYVAKEIEKWPNDVLSKLDPMGIAKIEEGAGVTLSQAAYTSGRLVDAKSIVYAVADRGTPQHEAVHAYCAQAFGRTGPVWYSEGMAEVGQYWKEKEKGVVTPEYVVKFIKESEPKAMDDIVNSPLEVTGDSWENYTWRWALCHLLGFNENYTERFRPLGLALLAGQEIDFWKVYGGQSEEISFEYDFFLKHIEVGFRCDLCSWDWKSKYALPRKRGTSSKIEANRGWQASKVLVEAGVTYEVNCTGEWSNSSEGDVTAANGGENETSQIVAAIFNQYKLSEEIAITFDVAPVIEKGKPEVTGTFTASGDGQLVFRCKDGWGSLSDNTGSLLVRVTKQEEK